MPRRPTLSPSKITTYLACPVKYRWTYVDPRGKWLLRARPYYSFGLTLHKVLERFHDSEDKGVETLAQAVAAYDESWIDAGYASAEEMAEAYGDGKVIVETYVAAQLARPRAAKTLFVERTLRMNMGEFDLIGRIDRLDQMPDGTLRIVDYKSQRQRVTEEDVAADLAMGIYQLLVRAEFPGKPVEASIIALKTGSEAVSALSDEEAAEFAGDLQVLGREILARDYLEIRPVAKSLCLDCDFVTLCREDPEFRAEVDALTSSLEAAAPESPES